MADGFVMRPMSCDMQSTKRKTMNKLTKNTIKWIAVISVVLGMKYAGDIEYRDAVIGSMSDELYKKVLSDLGGTASEKEICDKYISDKKDYDSLGF